MEQGVANHILTGRKKRWGGSVHIPEEEIGDSASNGEQAKIYANRLTDKHVYLRCPIEGGNMLTGSDFVIVGKDSLYATMGLYKVDEAKAKAMIGDDFGIAADKVYPVEQPGVYHLDLAMALVTGRNVLIKTPPNENHISNTTINDLEKQGFTVTFDEGKAAGTDFNFINGEFVKAGDKTYFLTNEPTTISEESNEKKEAFTKFIKDKFPAISDVVFIKEAYSPSAKAGLGCRVKGMPNNVTLKK
ncbi:MAG: hypothetical protein FWE27_02685 [Defluviitaleaceae bacterium]|nr:hypothetical protein [Defluviitaleaceae bacterium]